MRLWQLFRPLPPDQLPALRFTGRCVAPFCSDFRLRVFYLVEDDGAVVIGVIHGSHHPRLWKSRL